MTQRYPPIALFVYKRLWHTQQTVESLLLNKEAAESKLIIFSDAPKNPADVPAVMAVRNYLHTLSGFAEIEFVEREINFGLANSIISGVSSILEHHEQVIVLEDDLYLSPYFLQFMHEALQLYRDEPSVAAIHGYLYPLDIQPEQSFFIRGADCWGWATWKRAWEHFNPDGTALLRKLESENLTSEFDFYGCARYTSMLKKQIKGQNDSWAIRWSASAFLDTMFTLYPPVSLVKNIGMDGQGTHSDDMSEFDTSVAQSPIRLVKLPVQEQAVMRLAFARFFKTIWPSLFNSVVKKLFRLFR